MAGLSALARRDSPAWLRQAVYPNTSDRPPATSKGFCSARIRIATGRDLMFLLRGVVGFGYGARIERM
jgi:hypothetical protein